MIDIFVLSERKAASFYLEVSLIDHLNFIVSAGGLNTVQTDIEYVETSPGYALEIEKAVFQSIRNRIRKWRSKRQRLVLLFSCFASNY